MSKFSLTTVVIATAGIGLFTACDSNSAETSSKPTVVVTVTATPTPSPSTVATPTPSPTPVADETTAAPKPKPKPEPQTYTMPNEVGHVLQSAQEDIEGMLGVPVWPLLKSHDVKEGWRFQVLDRDWKVCDQDPAPGDSFDDTTVIDFGVVKLDERCP